MTSAERKASLREVAVLVQMIADGTILEEEVRSIINRPRSTEAKRRRCERTLGRDARAAAKVKDAYWLSKTYAAIGSVTKDQGDFTAARDAAATVEDAYSRSEAYAAIAGALAKAGDFTAARDAAATVEDAYSRSKTYAALYAALIATAAE